MAIVGVLLTFGCGQSGANASWPPTPTTPTAAVRTPSRSSTCTNAQVIQVIRTWPAARLAAEVVAVPVFDFDLQAVESEVGDGAGGVVFLYAAPVGLSSRRLLAR